jgi:hypothetical protein
MPCSLVRRSVLVAPLVLAGLVAGCGTGGSPPLGGPSTMPAEASPAVDASGMATPVTSASATAALTPVPTAALSEPPMALLVGETLPGEPAVGDLGSYTWGEEGSDAPWIVSDRGAFARPGTPVSVTFDPSVSPPAWTVRWAPITAAGAGDVASASQGTDEVTFEVPDRAGAWSLQLEARFGSGHGATWYWRVDVQ